MNREIDPFNLTRGDALQVKLDSAKHDPYTRGMAVLALLDYERYKIVAGVIRPYMEEWSRRLREEIIPAAIAEAQSRGELPATATASGTGTPPATPQRPASGAIPASDPGQSPARQARASRRSRRQR